MSKCIGCGIKLQDINKDLIGYTNDLNNKYCERCFKTIHYNIDKKINNVDNEIIIDKINKKSYFTFFITDLLSINSSIINIYKRVNNKKILIINKCDLIPNNLKIEHLINNIKNVYNIKEDILFISAKKKINLNKVFNLIIDNKNIILCGETSSGKSTLINNLFDKKLTTSKYSNTTLDFIKIKYEDNIIIDSPGFNINCKEIYDNIKIITKQLNDNYLISINDLKIKSNSNLTFVVANNSIINSKKDNNILSKVIDVNDNSDILIDNGFIYIKNKTKIYSNKDLEVRKSIIGK